MKVKEREFERILAELKTLAQEMGASVRFERGDFKGGYCLLKTSKMIVINKLSTMQRKVVILSSALKELGLDESLMSPKLKEIIENMEGGDENTGN